MIADDVQGKLALGVAIVTASIVYILPSVGLAKLITMLGGVSNLVAALITGEDLSLQDIMDEINDLADQMVCAIYCGNSAADSLARLTVVIDDMNLSEAENQALKLFFPVALMNWAYTFIPEINESSIEADCSGCACEQSPCQYVFTNNGPGGGPAGSGTFIYDGLSFQLSSVDMGSYHVIEFLAPCGVEGCSNGNWCVSIDDYDLDDTIATNSRQFSCWVDGCGSFNSINYQFETPSMPTLGERLNVAYVNLTNPTAFSIWMTVYNPGPPCGDDPRDDTGCD
jgi:hypothetical protein